MQAIVTKFIPATNLRGSRIKATCERGSVIINYPHELSGDDIHRSAVIALVNKFADEDVKKYGTPKAGNPWLRKFVTGQMPDGRCAHVFI